MPRALVKRCAETLTENGTELTSASVNIRKSVRGVAGR